MIGPKITEQDFIERLGIVAVDRATIAARCVWRETALRDVGIDGQIEYVHSGVATGRLVAVQVKSGSSYWQAGDKHVRFKPDPKHAEYWARHPLPVILVLHDEDAGQTIWADARAQMRAGDDEIKVPRANVFDKVGVIEALKTVGPLPTARRPPLELLVEMARMRHPDPGFNLSYLDLFCGGMTDVANSLYFGMDLATATQEAIAASAGTEEWLGLGPKEFEFVDDYIAYLVANDIAAVDFDAWRRMANRFSMVGHWISPLTAVGEELVELIDTFAPDLSHLGVTRERWVSLGMDDVFERVPLQFELTRRLLEASSPPS